MWTTFSRGILDAQQWQLRVASLYELARQPASAEGLYRRILARPPANLKALGRLGRLLLRARRFDEAAGILRQATEINPSASGVAFQLARALHRCGRIEEAIKQYLEVLRLDPNHAKAFEAVEQLSNRLAARARSRQEMEAAASIGQQVLVLRKGSMDAHRSAERIAEKIVAGTLPLATQTPEIALEQFAIALSLAPDMPGALRGAAQCCERLDQLDDALAYWEKLAQVQPSAVEATLHRQRLLVLLGRTPGPAPLLGDLEHLAMTQRARALVGMLEGGGAAADVLDPQQRMAALDRARGLIAALEGGGAAADVLDPQQRMAALDRARGLIAALEGGGAAADVLDPQQRMEALDRARGLIAALEGGGAADVLDPQQRMAALDRARGLIAALEGGGAADVLDPQQRMEALDRARGLIAALEEGGAADVLDPQQRIAALDRAQALIAALEGGGAADVLDPQQRMAALDRARGLIAALPQGPVRSIETMLREARFASSRGRLEEAEALYGQILEGNRTHRVALAQLGRVHMRQRRWADAAATATRLCALQPSAPEPREMLARALLEDGILENAAAAYEALLRLQPESRETLVALGRLYTRLQTWPRACEVLGWLVELDPSVTSSRIAYGRALQHTGNNAEAEAQWQAVLAANPREPDALTLLGRFLTRSRPDRAFECWQTLRSVKPEAIEPPLQMARLRARQQGPAEARPFYEAVLERDPDHAESLTGIGQAIAAADRDKAIEHFTKWAERQPATIAPRLELARLYQQWREWDRAEAAYREILERNPRDRDTLARFAQLLSRDPARLEHALDLWRDIGDADPTSPFPYVQRAYLLERARRHAEAEAEYRAAIARAPNDITALIGLARLLSMGSNPSEAAELFSTVHRINPTRPDALLGLGRTLERLDDWDEALSAYDKALVLEPGNASALQYRGRLLRRLGRIDESIEQWRRVCATVPQNADAWHELVFMLATAEREPEALTALDAAEAALEPSAQTAGRLANAAAAAQFHDRAVRYFERAIALEPAEASHHVRFGQYYFRQGILDGAFHHLLDGRERKPSDLPVAKQLIDVVHALDDLEIDHVGLAMGKGSVGEILLPERLFGLVRRIADREIAPYEPVPRRVVVVSASLAPGGAERQVANLLKGLAAPGFDLDLSLFCISLSRRGRRDFFLPTLADTGVKVVVHEGQPVADWLAAPEVAPHARLIRRFPEEMVGPIAHWLGEFRRRRPQVVHAWQDSTSLTAVVAALLAGVPRIVLCARSVRPDNPRRRLKRFMHEGYQAVLGHPSVVLSNNSRAGADDYADWLDVNPGSIEVVYNGIDFDKLAESVDLGVVQQVCRDLGIPPDAPILGSAYRMSEEKRPSLWVEVAAAVARQNPRVHFVVCGDGPERGDMAELAARLGIGDRLHLPGSQANIASWYKIMDVVMLTSRHEGLPNVLLEAQSLGVPVVAPSVGGMSETVWQGVTGWTIKNADAPALAERVLHCIDNAEWRQAARAAAPSFVRKRFSMATMLRRTLEVYRIPERAR